MPSHVRCCGIHLWLSWHWNSSGGHVTPIPISVNHAYHIICHCCFRLLFNWPISPQSLPVMYFDTVASATRRASGPYSTANSQKFTFQVWSTWNNSGKMGQLMCVCVCVCVHYAGTAKNEILWIVALFKCREGSTITSYLTQKKKKWNYVVIIYMRSANHIGCKRASILAEFLLIPVL